MATQRLLWRPCDSMVQPPSMAWACCSAHRKVFQLLSLFILWFLVSTVIFLEKGSVRSKMLLEPHQSSMGKSRLVAWPLSPWKRNKATSLSPCLLWKAEEDRHNNGDLMLEGPEQNWVWLTSHFSHWKSYEETGQESRTACTGPSLHGIQSCSSNHSRGHTWWVTGPVALAWDCFLGLTILSPGKFFEKLSHRCPFGFSILIIKSMLCAENSITVEGTKRENVNNS